MLLDRIIALRNDRTIYRDGNKCLKVFEKNVSKAKIFTEAFNQTQAQCAGLNVPSISRIIQIDEKWAIVSDFIEGKSLDDKINENRSEAMLSLEKLVELQISMHTPRKTDLPELKDRLKRDIAKTELRPELKEDLLRILKNLPDGDGIFHGCFSPDNIIHGEDGKYYIIDWTHAAQGSIYADAASTYLTFMLEGCNEFATAYLKLFCRKTQSDVHRVRKWLPVISAAKLPYANERERKILEPWLEAVYFD
ncbi:MAG: phosphotransferase family protein [Acutalibacteraceae bacterium]|nr:aminoglycoside phosphotransferase family protein [Oscillospiraceae bacterium]